jgi:hypothetical protein
MGFKRRVHISIQKNEDETIDATITKFSNKLNTRRLFDILHKEVMSSPFFTDVSWQVDEDESLGWKVNPHPKSLTFNFCVLK